MCYTTPSLLLASPFSALTWLDDLADELVEPRMEVWPASRLHHSYFNRQLRNLNNDMFGWADQQLRALNTQNADQKMKLIEDGETDFKLNLSCKQFKPEDIQCKVDGHYLTVEGNHEEKSDNEGYSKRHFVRRVLLPEAAQVDKVECRFKPDGVLSITIPKKAPAIEPAAKETPIPITHESAEASK